MKVAELLVTIISSVIISGLLTLKFNYHNLFAETVSKSRMEWINCFRDEISTIIAALVSTGTDKDAEKDNIFQANAARAKLLTRLNQDTSKVGNEYNELLSEVIEGLDFSVKANNFDDYRVKTLIDLTRSILGPEWQRVKQEAKGRRKK